MDKKYTLSSSFSYKKPYSMQGTYKSHQLYRAMLLFLFLAVIVIPSRAQDTVLVKGTIYSQDNQAGSQCFCEYCRVIPTPVRNE